MATLYNKQVQTKTNACRFCKKQQIIVPGNDLL